MPAAAPPPADRNVCPGPVKPQRRSPDTGEGPCAGMRRDHVTQAEITTFEQLSARWSRVLGAATVETLGAALEMCLEDLGRFACVDVAFVTLVDDDECVCDDWHWIRPGKQAVSPAVGSHLRDTFASVTEFLKAGHVVAVNDITTLELSPSETALATANRLRAIAVVPVQISTALIGLAGLLVLDEPREWDRSILQQMKMLSELLVRAVIRNRDRGALALADARARRISEFVPAGLVLTDVKGFVNWVTPSFERMAGASARDLIGRHLLDLAHPDDHDSLSGALQGSARETVTATARLLLAGEWRWCDLSLRLASEPDSGVPDETIVSVHDNHRRQLETEELARASERDQLTGVANRSGLARSLDELAAQSASIIVAYCDVDGFKLVNDRDGHAAGDEALCAIARALLSAVRPQDIVARVGGDEFAVVIHDAAASRDIEAIAERMLASVRQDVPRATATLSIGISGPGPAGEASALLHAADRALYDAKRLGKDRFVVHPFPVAAGDGH